MAKCQPCLGADLKEVLTRTFPDLAETLAKLPDCSDPTGLQFCGRGQRAKSEYQVFMGSCLRERDKTKPISQGMKDCAHQWRQRK